MRIKLTLFSVILTILLLLSGCSSNSGTNVKVGFIYTGSTEDVGINQAQEEARLEMVDYFQGKVETISKSSVGEDNIGSVIYDMVNAGSSIIFISDNQYEQEVAQAASVYKNVDFVIYNGTVTGDNIKNYTAKRYEADYLCGIIAGMTTQNNLIGYVAADDSNTNLVQINAFALGVLNSNSDATVEVELTGYPVSDSKLNAAVSRLAHDGCDVVSSSLPDNRALIEASNNGLKVIGTNQSGLENTSNYLTSITLGLSDFYINEVQSIINGNFDNTPYVGTVYDSFVTLDDVGFNVGARTQAQVEETQEEIKNGNLAVFTGPFSDNEGNAIAAEGQVLSEADLQNMNYKLSNVKVLN